MGCGSSTTVPKAPAPVGIMAPPPKVAKPSSPRTAAPPPEPESKLATKQKPIDANDPLASAKAPFASLTPGPTLQDDDLDELEAELNKEDVAPAPPAPAPAPPTFDTILRNALEQGAPFVDPDFPADRTSLSKTWESLTADTREVWQQIVWIRVGDLVKAAGQPATGPLFTRGAASNLVLGELNDTYFLGTIAVLLHKCPEHLASLFLNNELNATGCYGVRICKKGMWQEVIIDDRIPCVDGVPVFSHSETPGNYWVLLLEKAYAKLSGCYQEIECGRSSEAITDIYGCPANLFKGEDIWAAAKHGQASQLLLCASVAMPLAADAGVKAEMEDSWMKDEEELSLMTSTVDLQGLMPDNCYIVVNVHEMHDADNNRDIRLMRLVNPLGKGSWTGQWSEQSPKWTPEFRRNAAAAIAAAGTSSSDADAFWMCFEDFLRFFQGLVVAYHRPHSTYTTKEGNMGNRDLGNTTSQPLFELCLSAATPAAPLTLVLCVQQPNNNKYDYKRCGLRVVRKAPFAVLATTSGCDRDVCVEVTGAEPGSYYVEVLFEDIVRDSPSRPFCFMAYANGPLTMSNDLSVTVKKTPGKSLTSLLYELYQQVCVSQGKVTTYVDFDCPDIKRYTWHNDTVWATLYENNQDGKILDENVELTLKNMTLYEPPIDRSVFVSTKRGPGKNPMWQISLRLPPGKIAFLLAERMSPFFACTAQDICTYVISTADGWKDPNVHADADALLDPGLKVATSSAATATTTSAAALEPEPPASTRTTGGDEDLVQTFQSVQNLDMLRRGGAAAGSIRSNASNMPQAIDEGAEPPADHVPRPPPHTTSTNSQSQPQSRPATVPRSSAAAHVTSSTATATASGSRPSSAASSARRSAAAASTAATKTHNDAIRSSATTTHASATATATSSSQSRPGTGKKA